MTVDAMELALAGKAMRDAQNAYYRASDARTAVLLAEAKRAERKFDALVRAVLQPEPPGLFDGPPSVGGAA